MIDQTTEGGKALQAVVKVELKSYLGQDYNDDVLPLYIVVMLAHGNQQPLVKDNLEAFLGAEKAGQFAAWLFDHLKENLEKYDPTPPVAQEEQTANVDPQEEHGLEVGRPDSGQKRSREKREKIQWKGEKQDRYHIGDMDNRDEKRRRSGDRGERTSRPDHDSSPGKHHGAFPDRDSRQEGRDRGSPRDLDRSWPKEHPRNGERSGYNRRDSPDQRDDDKYGRHGSRYDRHSSREDRLFSSGRLHDRFDGRDRHESRNHRTDDRRRDRRDNARSPTRERGPLSRRLGDRLGRLPSSHLNRSPSSTPPSSPRPGGKSSVFDRLKKIDPEHPKAATLRQERPLHNASLDAAINSRMRMDAVPGSKKRAVLDDSPASHESEAEVATTPTAPAASAPAAAGQDEVAAELRQIKEQLAKISAQRAEQKQTEMATQIARMAVVQNVHFNATPEILKAHFSGCGNLVSAVIEKEATGRPKGMAVLEFESEEGRKIALSLSGSLLLGRPITVLAKETPRSWSGPTSGHMEMGPPFQRAWGGPAFQRGRGRGPFPGRHTLKNNKYVRPTQGIPNGGGTTA